MEKIIRVRRVGFINLTEKAPVFVEVGQKFSGSHTEATVTKIVIRLGSSPAFSIHMSDGEIVHNVGIPYSAVEPKSSDA